jgi:hypothetical protein
MLMPLSPLDSPPGHSGEPNEWTGISHFPVRGDFSVAHGKDVGHTERHLLTSARDAECVKILSNRAGDHAEHRDMIVS